MSQFIRKLIMDKQGLSLVTKILHAHEKAKSEGKYDTQEFGRCWAFNHVQGSTPESAVSIKKTR